VKNIGSQTIIKINVQFFPNYTMNIKPVHIQSVIVITYITTKSY
jgi:hypothetical protein